jgi:hypothetical protein
VGKHKEYKSGQKFHNLELLNRTDSVISKTGRVYTAWICKCDCGKEITVTVKSLGKGKKSCGCLRED